MATVERRRDINGILYSSYAQENERNSDLATLQHSNITTTHPNATQVSSSSALSNQLGSEKQSDNRFTHTGWQLAR